MKITRAAILTAVAAAAISLTACSSAGTDSATADSTALDDFVAAGEQQDTAPENTENPGSPENPVNPESTAASGESAPVGAGPDGQLTTCLRGDGYGVNTLAVNQNTSCEFARATMGALIAGYSPDIDLRTTVPRTVSAYSPVTEQTYQMYCETVPAGGIRCTGGNNAAVYMYSGH